ncbi:hypothetical protein M3Y99_01909400 [Aphelenchoides fujianensis]|nr:hypothetical protein M3Y99_01909400 [Aphelenchoides fujianensis]
MAAARVLLLSVFVLSLVAAVVGRWYYELQQLLRCNEYPYADATIALFEYDTFSPNDLCYVTNSSGHGTWHAKGYEVNDGGKPDNIQMHIRHRCGTNGKYVCYYRDLGRDMWTSNKADLRVWRLDTIDLAKEKSDDCYYRAKHAMAGGIWESEWCA